MKTRYDELIARVRAAAAVPERAVPTELSGYLEKVRLHVGWDVPAFDEFGARADAMLSSGYALLQEADEDQSATGGGPVTP